MDQYRHASRVAWPDQIARVLFVLAVVAVVALAGGTALG